MSDNASETCSNKIYCGDIENDSNVEIQTELVRIYSSVKRRKLMQIEEIEQILLPLLIEHPEIKEVLDIVKSWKPEWNSEEEKIESSHILQS